MAPSRGVTIEIGRTEYPDAIDAATLPPFRNYARCPQCRRGPGVWVFYCPSCAKILGPHFHRECPCGATWEEH